MLLLNGKEERTGVNMATPRKIIISSNPGDVIKDVDNDACFSDPVETTEAPTGESVAGTYSFCGTCLDCQATTQTGKQLLDYMYVHVQGKSTRVKAPTMKLIVTDPGATIVGAVDWCGTRWTFPADNGKCVEVRPNNYQLRQIPQYEKIHRRAVNYNYTDGSVRWWGPGVYGTGAKQGQARISAIHKWSRNEGANDSMFGIGNIFTRVPNGGIDTANSDVEMLRRQGRFINIRPSRWSGPVAIAQGINNFRTYVHRYRHLNCRYTRNGNKFYPKTATGDCTATNTYSDDDPWPTVVPYPQLSSNYRISTSTRTTTSPVPTFRKGSVTDNAGLVYQWELASYWGTV
jgi:hypothetical protein